MGHPPTTRVASGLFTDLPTTCSFSIFTTLAKKSDAEDLPQMQMQPVGEQANAVVEQFVQALVSGNMTKLLSIVKTDAVLYSDGGNQYLLSDGLVKLVR